MSHYWQRRQLSDLHHRVGARFLSRLIKVSTVFFLLDISAIAARPANRLRIHPLSAEPYALVDAVADAAHVLGFVALRTGRGCKSQFWS